MENRNNETAIMIAVNKKIVSNFEAAGFVCLIVQVVFINIDQCYFANSIFAQFVHL